MPPKQTRDPEKTKETLLNAAEDIFLEKGFGNTSLSAIAKHSGLTKSLIHHYFGSKEGLWKAVKERRFNDYSDRQMEMLNTREASLNLLQESFVLYFHFLKENPQLIRILAWMFLERDQDDCLKKDKELIKQGVEKIKIAQANGQIRADIDPKFILFIFLAMCQHWFQDKAHFISDFFEENEVLPENMDELYLDTIYKIFFKGIEPEK